MKSSIIVAIALSFSVSAFASTYTCDPQKVEKITLNLATDAKINASVMETSAQTTARAIATYKQSIEYINAERHLLDLQFAEPEKYVNLICGQEIAYAVFQLTLKTSANWKE